jgi:hypothetical protein
MKRFLGRSPGSLSWRLAAPAAVAVALLAVGIAFGVYFVSEATDGTSVAQEAEEPTATVPAAHSSPAPAVTPEPSPTLPPCLPCEARDRDQLRVNAEDIRLAPDGKYYIPDRGDGCAYQEVGRVTVYGIETVSLWAPGCEELRDYEPATGRVHVLIP